MIVASVVTVPGRTNDLISVLDDLLKSTRLPNFLYVSVSKFYPRLDKSFSEKDLEILENYLKNYPIENRIVFYDIDLGPCLKLLTPIKEHDFSDDDDILIFDDDNGLFPTALECLVNISERCGKSSVYGIMGVSSGNFIHGEYITSGDYYPVDVLGGYRGVLYPVRTIDIGKLEKWVDMFVMGFGEHNMIAMHDDHIFSYYLKFNKIESRVVNVHPKDGLNYWPKPNNNGIFQDSRLNESLKILDKVLLDNNIVL